MFIQIDFDYGEKTLSGLKISQLYNRQVYTGVVVVSFRSDYSVNYQGYHMTFKSVGSFNGNVKLNIKII